MLSADPLAPRRFAPPRMQWLALFIGAIPTYGWPFLVGPARAQTVFTDLTPQRVLLGIAGLWVVFGGLMYLSLRFICGESLNQLQNKPGRAAKDIGDGIVLWLVLFLAGMLVGFITRATGVMAHPSPALVAQAQSMVRDPRVLLVLLGPMCWLSAGLYEEFGRVFVLTRLQRVWPSIQLAPVRILISAILFGMAHSYQGLAGMLSAYVLGVILGWHFERFGRFLPLVIGHALTDMLGLLWWWAYYRQGMS